jgi:hypothetical protein
MCYDASMAVKRWAAAQWMLQPDDRAPDESAGGSTPDRTARTTEQQGAGDREVVAV